MTFHDTKKNKGYHSLFSYFDMFRGTLFSGHGVYAL